MGACIVAGSRILASIVTQAGTQPDPRYPFLATGFRLPVPVIQDNPSGWAIVGVEILMTALLAIGAWRVSLALGQAAGDARVRLFAGQIALLALMTTFSIIFSSDVYAYCAYGRLYGVHDVNPYNPILMADGSHDEILRQIAAFFGSQMPSDNYGPLFTLVAGAIARAEAQLPLADLVWTFRAFAAVCAVVAAAGLWKIVARRHPLEAGRRVALFAFHPLVLYESAAGAHNDIFMVALAVWSAALLETYPLIAGMFLGLSISVKYVSVLALPFFAIKSFKRRKIDGVLFTVIAVAIPILLFKPFWLGSDTFASLAGQRNLIATSLPWLLTMWFPTLTAAGLAAGGLIVLASVVAYSLYRWIRADRWSEIWRVIAASLLVAPILNTWYVQWLLPAVADSGAWARYAWWLGVFVFLRQIQEVARVPETGAGIATMIRVLEILTVVIIVAPIVIAQLASRNHQESVGVDVPA
jgi:alpha-1,6-mannosyltransferase